LNASKNCNLVYWGTAGCGSRGISSFIYFIGCDDFLNTEEDKIIVKECSHTHNVGIPEGYEDCDLIAVVRNPYSLFVSRWLDEANDMDPEDVVKGFKDYVLRNQLWNYFGEGDFFHLHQWREVGRFPDYILRMEHFEEDLRKVSQLVEKELFEEGIQSYVRTNFFKNGSKYDEYIGEIQNYKKYWTKDIADFYYNKMEEYFTTFGYDKDSWM
jgi:hypothetical protein